MTTADLPTLSSRFPNLRADVVRGYEEAPVSSVAEVLDGELFVLPRPRRQHQRTAMQLSTALNARFGLGTAGPAGWEFLAEPELHLGPTPDIVVPDLAGWVRGRLAPDFFADEAPAEIALAPDWVCEVLSPGTEAQDRGRKRRIYRREGVKHLWLLSPELRSLEVYRLEGGRWVEVETYEGDGVVRAEPFDTMDLSLASLWPAKSA